MRISRIIVLLSVLAWGIASHAQDTIRFHNGSLKESLQLAKKEKKTVVLDFYADWCLPCKQMEKHTFSKPAVIEHFNSKYVVHRVDMEMFDGMDIGDKFRVKSLPALVYLDRRGRERFRKVGFQSAEEILVE